MLKLKVEKHTFVTSHLELIEVGASPKSPRLFHKGSKLQSYFSGACTDQQQNASYTQPRTSSDAKATGMFVLIFITYSFNICMKS